MTMTDTTPKREYTEAESAAILELQELTDAAWKIRMEATRIAVGRREAIEVLRGFDWSYRRIGETIGVSGQRIDSMLRLGAKLAEELDDQPITLD